MSIVGFITCGLTIIFGLLVVSQSQYASSEAARSANGSSFFLEEDFVLLLLGAVYFFPSPYLYNFLSKMSEALGTSDQEGLARAFSHLKSLFRYMTILSVLFIAFTLLVLYSFFASDVIRGTF